LVFKHLVFNCRLDFDIWNLLRQLQKSEKREDFIRNYAEDYSKDVRTVRAPAFKVEAIDTTGAGDGWNAGLLVGLCRGWDLETCATVANTIGATVVTKRGAITAMPSKKDLAQFLEHHGCFVFPL
jgi:sugar/nucleoside kinase (ribokinase family)